MSDGDLVRQALAGRTEVYAELVRRWAGRVTALCHAKIGRADAAEDLAQETLLRGYRTLASLADAEKFGPWLCAIAQHVCLDWLKSKQRTQIPFSALGAGSPDPADSAERSAVGCALEREDDVRQLMSEVEALPDECREVVMLYYYQDVTYQDVARLLGVSSATVNARLTRARALLRERLGKVRR